MVSISVELKRKHHYEEMIAQYNELIKEGEETKEISLTDLTDDMIKSVICGWDGVGSIRLESVSAMEISGKTCSFALTVTPANGLIQNAYFADFEIIFS